MTTTKPTVSILSPAFNEAEHIAEMLDSLIAQTSENWEAVLVDDGSSDDTAAIIESYARVDSRVRLVSRGVKLGKARAFNLAHENAVGEVICLAGTDDTLPPDSVAIRREAFAGVSPDSLTVGYFKLKTFSRDPKFSGMILPRGNAPSRSGASLTMTRALSSLVFPIDPRLPAEDIWLSRAADALAERTITDQRVVLNYRIHPGNSNPRNATYQVMTDAMHARQLAFSYLLEENRFKFDAQTIVDLRRRSEVEDARYNGSLLRVLRSQLPLADRLAIAAMTKPTLFRVRQHFFKALSGRRGR